MDEKKIKEIESKIKKIEKRNKRVELDKAWEISCSKCVSTWYVDNNGEYINE